MNKKVLGKILVCLSFLLSQFLFLTGCKSTPLGKEKVDINGMVYDTDNKPVVNYTIYIDGNAFCTSDIGGRFVLKGIEKGSHIFWGKGEGYLGIEKEIVIYDKSQILYIRIPTIDSVFSEAFEHIKKDDFTKAEKLINEVLESDSDNEDALYFLKTIKKLAGEEDEDEE